MPHDLVVGVLKHQPHPPPRPGNILPHRYTVQRHLARTRTDQTVQMAHQHRLARAVGSRQNHELTPAHIQRNPVQGEQPVGKAMGEFPDPKQRDRRERRLPQASVTRAFCPESMRSFSTQVITTAAAAFTPAPTRKGAVYFPQVDAQDQSSTVPIKRQCIHGTPGA